MTPVLAVDVRNDLVTCGLGTRGDWRSVRRFGAMTGRSADEYAFLLAMLAPGGEVGADRPSAAWISSVVPQLTPVLVEAVRTAFGVAGTFVIGPGTRTGLRIRTDLPAELGSDLVCGAVAARELTDRACIVVDSGAALTFSAINARGEFLGAAIAPGILAATRSLRRSTAQLPDVRIEAPRQIIGRTTVQAMQAGIAAGYEGLVERILDRMSAELDPGGASGGVDVIGTGDDAGRSLFLSLGSIRFVPDLVLDGIALVAARNGSS